MGRDPSLLRSAKQVVAVPIHGEGTVMSEIASKMESPAESQVKDFCCQRN